ncbi:MAG: peptidoglycan DD-metalloendopeptidase family protein [Oscillospiraceae bacterium]|nr:peptidoglycan DD-metalloendopeptidase family protein [Oscillospiraceae bacterium]
MSFKKRMMTAAKICSSFLAAVLLFAVPNMAVSVNGTASGSSNIDDIQAQIDKIKSENEARKKQIAGITGDINKNQEAIKLINAQIDGVTLEIEKYGELIITQKQNIEDKQLEIENVENEVANRELEIEKKKAHIAELEAQNKKNLERFAELARLLYINDVSDTIPILSGSDDWYQYFVYSDVIKNISSQNLEFMKRLLDSIKDQEKMIEGLEEEINKLEADKLALQNQKSVLDSEMAELQTEKTSLEKYAAEQKNYLYGLAAKNKSLKDKIDGLEYDIEASRKKMEELDKELQELIRKAQQNGNQEDHSSGFRWPLDPQFHKLTTYFGWEDAFGGRNHGGIDIVGASASVSSQNIYTVQSGTVIKVYNGCKHDNPKWYSCGCGGGWGNYIVIDHGGKISTLYAHCRKIFVSEGQKVTKGDVIGLVGTTGWSTGEHLHFEVRVDGIRVDPLNYTYHDVY